MHPPTKPCDLELGKFVVEPGAKQIHQRHVPSCALVIEHHLEK